MGLKDEIERLIRTEREKLEARDQEHSTFNDIQRARFASLRAALGELTQTVEATYLRLTLHDSSALLELGHERDGYFYTESRYEVQPNFETDFFADRGTSLFREAPGYHIEEIQYFEYPEYDTSEHTAVFDDESIVAEHLAKKIAEHVAHRRHLAAIMQRRKG